MAMYCSVHGCNTRRLLAPLRKDSFFVFLFPKENNDRRRAWTLFCSREGFTPGPRTGICSRHFTEEDYENAQQYDFQRSSYPTQKARLDLKNTAIPSRNPPVPKEISRSATERRQRALDREHDETIVSLLNDQGHYLLIEPDEVEEEAYNQELDEMNDDDVENDPMWVPDETPQIDQGKHTKASLRDLWKSEGDLCEQKKFIVTSRNLLDILFKVPCQECGELPVQVDSSPHGAVMAFTLFCLNKHSWSWQTAGDLRSDTKPANALLLGSILYTGSQPAKVIEYMSSNQILFPSDVLYFRYQLEIFCAVVLYMWLEEQKRNIEIMKSQEKVILGGDARCDSMGFCAQFGSYCLMDMTTHKIVDIQAVSRVETEMISPNMEKEGLVRGLAKLADSGVKVTDLVTDQHMGIAKMMRNEYKAITHWYDTWHVVKGIKKQLVAVTKEKEDKTDKNWSPLSMDRVKAVCNRLYYMPSHTKVDDKFATVMEEKRVGLLNHLIGICEFPNNTYYKKCHHPTKKDRMNPDSSAYKKVKAILSNPRRRKAIMKMSPHGQTSQIESYHRVVLAHAPKHLSFGFQGMNARLLLAAIQFNENCDRPVILDEGGREKMRVQYLKYQSGTGKAKLVRPPATKEYLKNLMKLTEQVARGDGSIQLPVLPPTPATMTSQLEREPAAVVLERHSSRFALAAEIAVPEPLAMDEDTSNLASVSTMLSPASTSTYYVPPSDMTIQTPQSTAALKHSTPSTSKVQVTKKSRRKL